MRRIVIVAVLLASAPGIAAAQQPDHVAVHGLVALSVEADPHLGGAESWQKHVGRNWGLNLEYDFSTTALTANKAARARRPRALVGRDQELRAARQLGSPTSSLAGWGSTGTRCTRATTTTASSTPSASRRASASGGGSGT